MGKRPEWKWNTDPVTWDGQAPPSLRGEYEVSEWAVVHATIRLERGANWHVILRGGDLNFMIGEGCEPSVTRSLFAVDKWLFWLTDLVAAVRGDK